MSKDYLKEFDGGVEITLSSPADIGGAKLSTLRLREPTVRDLEAAQKASGGDEASHEVQLFANLLEVTPDDIRNLKFRNYKRVQTAFGLFTD